jgi:hypothetical protein
VLQQGGPLCSPLLSSSQASRFALLGKQLKHPPVKGRQLAPHKLNHLLQLLAAALSAGRQCSGVG